MEKSDKDFLNARFDIIEVKLDGIRQKDEEQDKILSKHAKDIENNSKAINRFTGGLIFLGSVVSVIGTWLGLKK